MTTENKEKRLMDIILVNSDYKKMAAKKKAILETNAETVKTNKKIEKQKRVNSALAFVFSLLFAGGIGVLLWLLVTEPIYKLSLLVTKIVLIAAGAICSFGIIEGLSLVRKKNLDKRKKNILAISEEINFVTFVHEKTVESYSITKHEETPCHTQQVYVTFTMDDNGKKVDYVSMEKWTLVFLPTLFDVVINAEDTTLYLPYEDPNDKESVLISLNNRKNQELINLEKEARLKAEEKLTAVLAEKEALERVMIKNSELTADLQKSLDETKAKLENADSRHKEEHKDLLVLVETQKQEIEGFDAIIEEKNKAIEDAQKTITEKTENEDRLHANIKKLEGDLLTSNNELLGIKEQHNAEIAKLKGDFIAAAKTAKETLVQNHEDEIRRLREENENSTKHIIEESERLKEENQKLHEEIESQRATVEKAKASEASVIASFGAQERALAKELEEMPVIKRENERLKKELGAVDFDAIAKMKKDYEEKISSIKEEKNKMEEKMRDALTAAAREKAERIKMENALKKAGSNEGQSAQDAARLEAEMAKAKEAAEKAQMDAQKAKEEAEKENKRPQRRLNI